MRKRVIENDVARWSESFISELRRTAAVRSGREADAQ
jgi:hypothetical protein